MHNDVKTIMFTEAQIKQRVQELGAQISRDYAGKNILLCGILKGAVMFYHSCPRCKACGSCRTRPCGHRRSGDLSLWPGCSARAL